MSYKLYLEAFSDDETSEKLFITLESSIVLFLLEFVERPFSIHVFLVPSPKNGSTEPVVEVIRDSINFTLLSADSFASEIASNCSFPVIVNDNIVIAGLCSVCRAIVKYSDESFRYLLGFKESCLLAPCEASPWTKFCEVDMITSTKSVLKFHSAIQAAEYSGQYQLPKELGYFESHLNQPVKAHNIRKIAQDIAKKAKVTDSSKKDIPGRDIILNHKFVEGPQISIADLILFPSFWLLRNIFDSVNVGEKLPLTCKWIEAVKEFDRIRDGIAILTKATQVQCASQINYDVETTEAFTLYKRESRRYKPKTRLFTREYNIEPCLQKVAQLGIEIVSLPGADPLNDEWTLPFDALPEGGNLPQNRLQRKKDQLFSVANEIMAITKTGDRIVDFCSGQGHLAIILAYKLPQCLIYVLDNKEESLSRAKQRVERLNLTNIRFFQCNLDYFIGSFEIGTSLHACGIASDIVLMHCKERDANFVCCPCCYGKVIEMPHISFPRSKFFKSNNITMDEYLCIAHCADQAHDMNNDKTNVEKSIQGYYCMDIIDTDRKLYMEECGYKTKLTRLYPEDCTTKNRLLIGIKH